MAKQEIALPDYLKDMMDDTSSQGLISQTSSVPRISLKGQKFRFIVDGEEVKRINEEFHAIILGVQPERGFCKTYYKGKYNPDSSDPPDCSSTDGVVPDSWVSNPVSDTCAKCEMNAWGSAKSMSGGKAKACRDSKRLYVVEAKEMSGTIYILNVTVASLKALSEYGKLLVSNRIPMAAAITTLTMDDEADHPKLQFEFKGVLNEKMGKKALARAAEGEWKEMAVAISNESKTKQIEHQDDDDDDDEEPTPKKKKAKKDKVVKGEIVDDDDDESPMSDVDDLLDGWDD